MALFQQIPATVDAEQFLRDDQPWPAEVKPWSEEARPLYGSDAWIQTASGAVLINNTDWVLHWLNGSITVCKNDVFRKSFVDLVL